METKDPKSAESACGNDVVSKDSKSDATSTETLSDIEDSAKVSEEGEDTTKSNGTSSTPSPDGAFDEGRGGQNGIDDAGPM
jgi:hypothetical protein